MKLRQTHAGLYHGGRSRAVKAPGCFPVALLFGLGDRLKLSLELGETL